MTLTVYEPFRIVREARRRVREPDAAALTQIALGVVVLACGVPAAEILSSTRRSEVARARQTAMYLSHVVFQLSLSRVGKAFGRDRTTATYACKVIEEAREDPEIDLLIAACEESLRHLPLSRRARRKDGRRR